MGYQEETFGEIPTQGNLSLSQDFQALIEEKSLSIKRHDNHNLEIKFSLPLEKSKAPKPVQMNLYFFLPQNFQAHSWSKGELLSDFFSRQRISLPREDSIPPLSLKKRLEEIRFLLKSQIFSPGELLTESESANLMTKTQELGAFFGENLKSWGSRLRRELLALHSLARVPISPTAEFQKLARSLREMESQLNETRSVLKLPMDSTFPLFQFLEEYLHHLFIEALKKIDDDLRKLKLQTQNSSQSLYKEGWTLLENTLQLILKNEKLYQIQSGLNMKSFTGSDGGELFVVRLGQMKKFFQSTMFVNVQKNQSLQKLSEPTAALAASFAAFFAGALQYFGNSHLFDYGLSGLSIGLSGMALYVLRDRLKDYGRSFLTSKISKILPDRDFRLEVSGQISGQMQEWLQTTARNLVPASILNFRQQAQVSQAEAFIGEDVLCLKREWNLKNENPETSLSIQDNLRVNLERYLKHLDDPHKEICLLDQRGRFSKFNSKKVYYFYIVSELIRNSVAQLGIHRVVIDKNGISKVLPISTSSQFT